MDKEEIKELEKQGIIYGGGFTISKKEIDEAVERVAELKEKLKEKD